MQRARLIVLVPLLLVAGCSVELFTGARPGELDFSWEPAGWGHWLPEPELEVTEGRGRIAVSARLSAADPCQRLTGELDRRASRLTLRVTIRRVGQGCVAAIGTFAYDATIRGLAPGEYTLRVVHDYPNTGWPSGTVLERQVTVR
jgi:hypothetical protein